MVRLGTVDIGLASSLQTRPFGPPNPVTAAGGPTGCFLSIGFSRGCYGCLTPPATIRRTLAIMRKEASLKGRGLRGRPRRKMPSAENPEKQRKSGDKGGLPTWTGANRFGPGGCNRSDFLLLASGFSNNDLGIFRWDDQSAVCGDIKTVQQSAQVAVERTAGIAQSQKGFVYRPIVGPEDLHEVIR